MSRLRALQFLGGKGGKRSGFSMAEWIASRLPVRGAYCEPFSGMAGVLLNRRPCVTELLNDRDGDIVNWWRAVRDEPEVLQHVLDHSPPAEEDFWLARDLLAEPYEYSDSGRADIGRAAALYRVLTYSLQHSNGKRPTFGINWKSTIVTAPIRVSALAKRLRRVQLLS